MIVRNYNKEVKGIYVNSSNMICLSNILLFAIIVFSPTFFNGFQSGWDDQWMVTNGYTSEGLTIDNLKGIFLNKYGGQYAPINQLFYTFIYYFFRYKPVYYHTACLLLHLYNIIMVYALLKRIYKWKFFNINDEQRLKCVLFCSLCFAINPLQVESVAWVSASKIVLYAFFYLLGTLLYVSFIEQGRKRYVVIALLCFALSLGSKEQAVVFPLWLLILHWAHGDFKISKRIRLYGLVPFFIVAALFGILYLLYASELDGDLYNITRGKNLLERFEIAGFAISVYIRRWFVPIDLQHIYMMPDSIPVWFLACPICLTLFVLVGWKKINRTLVFWLLCFLIHICLSLHLIPMGRFTIMADRYMYLSCIGIANVLFLTFMNVHKGGRKKKIMLIVLLSFWGLSSFLRTQDWYNTERIRANNSIIVKLFN